MSGRSSHHTLTAWFFEVFKKSPIKGSLYFKKVWNFSNRPAPLTPLIWKPMTDAWWLTADNWKVTNDNWQLTWQEIFYILATFGSFFGFHCFRFTSTEHCCSLSYKSKLLLFHGRYKSLWELCYIFFRWRMAISGTNLEFSRDRDYCLRQTSNGFLH